MQGRLKALQAKGPGLAAISYDSPVVLAAFAKHREIRFPLFSGQGSAAIKRYEILNPVPEMATGLDKYDPAVKADTATYMPVVRLNAGMIGIAFPGTFILDPKSGSWRHPKSDRSLARMQCNGTNYSPNGDLRSS